ncbi:LicD family protein [Bacillus timonensis]|nr:LicD family protein [Bacillus timonensis]
MAVVESILKYLRTSKLYEGAKNNKLLRTFKTKYDKAQYAKMQASVHINGLEMLEKVKEGFAEIGEDFWLDYGTLLGAVREKDFIGHDKDIDIGAFDFDDAKKKQLEKALVRKGIQKYKQYEMDGKIIEEAYHYKGVHFDIFYYQKGEGNQIWCYFCEIGPKMSFENFPEYQLAKGYLTHKVTSRFEGLMPYEFKGKTFKIPTNYHEYLIDNYGETYMKPIKNWSSGNSSSNITPVEPEKAQKVTVREYI